MKVSSLGKNGDFVSVIVIPLKNTENCTSFSSKTGDFEMNLFPPVNTAITTAIMTRRPMIIAQSAPLRFLQQGHFSSPSAFFIFLK